jgi:hypothetical protein
MSAEAAY